MHFGRWSELPERERVRVIVMAAALLLFLFARLMGVVAEGHSFLGDTALEAFSVVGLAAGILGGAAVTLRGE